MNDGNALKLIRRELRAEQTDLYNRLHSIHLDSAFVSSLVQSLDLPCIPNPRCGSWYVDPKDTLNCNVYFKSTDGHWNSWAFNLRRANLHLVNVIAHNQGIILVDSTRRGKRYPDALSKTIPIWCQTINLTASRLSAEFPDVSSTFSIPSEAVSPSEQDQILQRLSSFADNLQASAYPLHKLLGALKKPLKPVFASPAHPLPHILANIQAIQHDYHPVVCVSASKCLEDRDISTPRWYVPGSGDDDEAWARGLSPKVFWKRKDEILAVPRSKLQELIDRIVVEERAHNQLPTGSTAASVPIPGTPLAFALDPMPHAFSTISFYDKVEPDAQPATCFFKLLPGKKGLEPLFAAMPALQQHLVTQFAAAPLVLSYTDADPTSSRNAMLAIALVWLCTQDPVAKDKAAVRSRLQAILNALDGKIQPSRTMLNRVNEHLLSSQHRQK